ncbi:Putative SWI/SNF-related matrix-associated actin-dependent regulator of chromatin subfamily A member 3-like 1, partial [Linum grandiflorum]
MKKDQGMPTILKKHDIVLTTYNTLASEDSMAASPMKQIELWRVILDEA